MFNNNYNPYLSREGEGYKIEVYNDWDGHADPRDNDNIGIMVVECPGFSFGDDTHGFYIPDVDEDGIVYELCEVCGGDEEVPTGETQTVISEYTGAEYEEDIMKKCEACNEGYHYIAAEDWIRREHDGAYVVLVNAYDAHYNSRCKIADSDNFNGYVIVTWESLKRNEIEHFTHNELKDLVEAEIEEYDLYLQGEVYGYSAILTDEEGNEIEELDACWGFIGNKYFEEELDSIEKTCQEAVIDHKVAVEKERQEAKYWLEREVMTI